MKEERYQIGVLRTKTVTPSHIIYHIDPVAVLLPRIYYSLADAQFAANYKRIVKQKHGVRIFRLTEVK